MVSGLKGLVKGQWMFGEIGDRTWYELGVFWIVWVMLASPVTEQWNYRNCESYVQFHGYRLSLGLNLDRLQTKTDVFKNCW